MGKNYHIIVNEKPICYTRKGERWKGGIRVMVIITTTLLQSDTFSEQWALQWVSRNGHRPRVIHEGSIRGVEIDGPVVVEGTPQGVPPICLRVGAPALSADEVHDQWNGTQMMPQPCCLPSLQASHPDTIIALRTFQRYPPLMVNLPKNLENNYQVWWHHVDLLLEADYSEPSEKRRKHEWNFTYHIAPLSWGVVGTIHDNKMQDFHMENREFLQIQCFSEQHLRKDGESGVRSHVGWLGQSQSWVMLLLCSPHWKMLERFELGRKTMKGNFTA